MNEQFKPGTEVSYYTQSDHGGWYYLNGTVIQYNEKTKMYCIKVHSNISITGYHLFDIPSILVIERIK